MDTVYLILQVVTISITALTLGINVFITIITNKQKNYNEVITNNRIEFLMRNRESMSKFIAEARNFIMSFKLGNKTVNIKPLYSYFEQICITLKTYNEIDREIVDAGKKIIDLTEKSILNEALSDDLSDAIDKFSLLVNIYDDADWKFIKQQFNSTNKTSDDFDKMCEDIKTKYMQ